MFTTKILKNILLLCILGLLASCGRDISTFQSGDFVKYFGNGQETIGYHAIEAPDGGYIVVGSEQTTSKRKEVIAIRVNKFGNLVWLKTYGTNHNDEAFRVGILESNIYIFGQTTNSTSAISQSFMLLLGSNGDSLDFKLYGTGAPLWLNDITISDNLIYAVGEKRINTSDPSDFYICCINSLGEIVWQRPNMTGSGNQMFKRVFRKSNGNLLAVGTNNAIAGSQYNQVVVTELTANGIGINYYSLPATSDQLLIDAIFDGANLYILYNTNQQGSLQAQIFSISSSLVLQWQSESIPEEGKSIGFFNESKLAIACQNDANILFNFFSIEGTLVDGSHSYKSLPGIANGIYSTSDKGLMVVGSTSPEYGTMLQLIKTATGLFLINP